MQPGQGYTQDDFSQPAFCRACGAHVPKSFLAGSGGLCVNCLRNLQQMSQTGQMTAMPFAQPHRQPRQSFFRSAGCVATLVGLIAVGLLGAGAVKYLKLSSIVGGGHKVAGVSDQLANHPSLVDETVDDATATDLRTMAAKEINDAFGSEIADARTVDTEAVRDKLKDEITYYAGGSFDCIVRKDWEHVSWKIAYVRDEGGKWRRADRQAWYQTSDGVAQFDFDAKAFIHLSH